MFKIEAERSYKLIFVKDKLKNNLIKDVYYKSHSMSGDYTTTRHLAFALDEDMNLDIFTFGSSINKEIKNKLNNLYRTSDGYEIQDYDFQFQIEPEYYYRNMDNSRISFLNFNDSFKCNDFVKIEPFDFFELEFKTRLKNWFLDYYDIKVNPVDKSIIDELLLNKQLENFQTLDEAVETYKKYLLKYNNNIKVVDSPFEVIVKDESKFTKYDLYKAFQLNYCCNNNPIKMQKDFEDWFLKNYN